MKLKNIILVVFAAILFTFILVVVFGSGALSSTMGIVYFVSILVASGIIFFMMRKLYIEYREEKKILDISKDPEKIYQKLTADGKKYIDYGREVEITLKENQETGKKELDIKLGKKVEQEWRKKFERTPIKKLQNQENKNPNTKNQPKNSRSSGQ